ncbi:hypothetical protein [Kordiimonas aquimaris]|uniref:hypothetical protein n=1 Tax=Kordiimonas aquimaris TaxID=707591 RepID=UPI0021D1855F|nr:hypothetical protein [Kordiimonas aquimaris]
MKTYVKTAAAVFLWATSSTLSPVIAADCGEQPLDMPKIPTGEALTAATIRTARDEVLAYSDKVDAYIACMDQNGLKVAAFMTKEQKARRQDDLSDLHNERRDLQLALNEAIREFRRSRQSR